MKYRYPTRMESPNPVSHRDSYYMRRIITTNQIELHWHNFFEIDFVDDGHGTHILNGVEQPFSGGTLTVLSTFDFHAYNHDLTRGDHISAYSFHFNDHVPDEDTLRRLRCLSGKQLSCGNGALFEILLQEFRLLEQESRSSQPERDALVQNILGRITIYAARCLEEYGEPEGKGRAYVEMEYIERNFRQPISLGDVARAAGFSTDYFGKLFKRRYGIPFQEYLLARRLQWAYGLLCSSSLSVTSIAYEAGFNSHAYFCRCFKRQYGVSPLQARQRTPEQP
ncbi:MAG: AraC family transcriptional regulator [Clostridia bacterium]|nr:AraC family transcriptional regulator [Clostridia bacterium]